MFGGHIFKFNPILKHTTIGIWLKQKKAKLQTASITKAMGFCKINVQKK